MRLMAILMAALLAWPVQAQVAAPNQPAVTEEARALARELTETTGAAKLASTMLGMLRNQMAGMVQRGSGKPADEAGRIVDEVLLPEMQGRTEELARLIQEIYIRNYTLDEMRGLIAFYATPLGKRLIELAPQIGQQSFVAGQAWGQMVVRDALARKAQELRDRGVKL